MEPPVPASVQKAVEDEVRRNQEVKTKLRADLREAHAELLRLGFNPEDPEFSVIADNSLAELETLEKAFQSNITTSYMGAYLPEGVDYPENEEQARRALASMARAKDELEDARPALKKFIDAKRRLKGIE